MLHTNTVPFAIDQTMAMAQSLRPDCKPGVRIVAGKPWTYDAGLLRSFECREMVCRAEGVDLWRLQDDTLDALVSAALRRWADTKHGDRAAGELAERAIAEQRRRALSVKAVA